MNKITYTENTKPITYYLKGYETDTNQQGKTNKHNFNQITKPLTEYINQLTPRKHNKTTQQVLTELSNHYNYNN